MVAHARRAGEIAGRPVSGDASAANCALLIRGATTTRNRRETLSGGMRDSQTWLASETLRWCSVGVSIRGVLAPLAVSFPIEI